MSQLDKDRRENKFNGYLFMIAGTLVAVFAALFSDNTLGLVAGIVVGILVSACGLWLIRAKAVYWLPGHGFSPKRGEQQQ